MLLKVVLLVLLIVVPLLMLIYSGPRRSRKPGKAEIFVANVVTFIRRTFLLVGTLVFLFGGIVSTYHAMDNLALKYLIPAVVFYVLLGLSVWWGVVKDGYANAFSANNPAGRRK
ncbi:MAG TPA: hypothetical protein VM553_20045 [Dongiaceae bacterium]|nr:hypothetical protein [Dongiaceae bacterium]